MTMCVNMSGLLNCSKKPVVIDDDDENEVAQREENKTTKIFVLSGKKVTGLEYCQNNGRKLLIAKITNFVKKYPARYLF